MASISEALQNFARLPYRLYIPSSFCQTPIKKWHANGVGQVFVTKIDSNLGVLQWAMLLLLCLCLQQFKTRHFHLILLSNLLYSTLTLVCVVVTVIVLMNWKVICNTCSRQIAKLSIQPNTKLFAGDYFLSFHFYYKIVFTSAWTSLQDLLTVQVNIQILPCAIFLESSINGFSFHCYGYMPFTVLQHLV